MRKTEISKLTTLIDTVTEAYVKLKSSGHSSEEVYRSRASSDVTLNSESFTKRNEQRSGVFIEMIRDADTTRNQQQQQAIARSGQNKGKKQRQQRKQQWNTTMARESKQHKCPSTEGRIKIWYIYTMKYCSATKRNKIGSFLEMCMDIETVIQS